MREEEDEEEKEVVDHRVFFSLIEQAGSNGPYQKVMLIIMCILGYLTGGLMLIAPYLFFQDAYKC